MAGQFSVYLFTTQFAIHVAFEKCDRRLTFRRTPDESGAFLFVSAIQLSGIEHQNPGTCAAKFAYIC